MLAHRLGGLAGLGFVALVGSANVLLGATGMPRVGAAQSDVAAYFAAHGDIVAIAAAIATLAWVCLGLFAAGVVARLREQAPARVESWPLLGLAGAFLQNALFAGVVACQTVLGANDLSDDARWLVWQLHNALFSFNGTALAITLLGLSVAGLRAGLIPRWHGGLGLTAATLLAVHALTTPFHEDAVALGTLGLVGFLLWLVWLVTYSLVLLRGARVTHSIAPAPAPAIG